MKISVLQRLKTTLKPLIAVNHCPNQTNLLEAAAHTASIHGGIWVEIAAPPLLSTRVHSPLSASSMADQTVTKTEYDIFISYSRRDKSFVHTLWEALTRRQYTSWVDWEDIPPASPWRQEIENGIIASHNFLAVLSSTAIASKECQNEVECAKTNNKRLIPIVISKIDDQAVPPALAKLNWIFFGPNQDFDTALQQLISALETDLDYARVHTRLLARTKDWRQHDQDPSYLLRGAELGKMEHWIVQEVERTPKLTPEQRVFVITSQQVEKDCQTRLIRNQRRRLMAAGIGLAVVAILASVAEFHRRAAFVRELEALSAISSAQFALDNPPAALLEALRAGVRLEDTLWTKHHPDLRQTVVSALGQAFYRIQEFNRIENPDGWIETVSFSPDGATLAVGGQGGKLWIWQPDNPTPEPLSGHINGIAATAFSADNQQLVSADLAGNIYLWQRQGQAWMPSANWFQGAAVRTATITADSASIIAAGDDGQIRIWNLGGQLQRAWPAHNGRIWKVRRQTNGQILSVGKDGRVAIWQPEGVLVRDWQGSDTQLQAAAIAPNGERVMTGDRKGVIRLWNWNGGLIREWRGHEGRVRDGEFTPDGQQLVTAGADQAVKFWRLDGSLADILEGHQNGVNDVSLNPTGDVAASASNDRTVRLWRRQKRFSTVLYHADAVYRAAYAPDAKRLATAGQTGDITLWRLPPEQRRVGQLQGHRDRVNDLAVSPDGQLLASASGDATVRLWRHADQTDQELLGHSTNVLSAAFSPDGQRVISADLDGNVIRWNLDGTQAQSWSVGAPVYAIRYSPNGAFMALAGADRTIHLLNPDGSPLRDLGGAESAIFDLAFSPDSRQIVSGEGDGALRLQTLQGELLSRFNHGAQAWAIAVSPDGQRIASGGSDGVVRLWDPSGALLVSLAGHQLDVEDLVFLDAERLVSAGSDGKVRLWDLSILNLRSLVDLSCNWFRDYLQTAPNLTPEDRQLCRGRP